MRRIRLGIELLNPIQFGFSEHSDPKVADNGFRELLARLLTVHEANTHQAGCTKSGRSVQELLIAVSNQEWESANPDEETLTSNTLLQQLAILLALYGNQSLIQNVFESDANANHLNSAIEAINGEIPVQHHTETVQQAVELLQLAGEVMHQQNTDSNQSTVEFDGEITVVDRAGRTEQHFPSETAASLVNGFDRLQGEHSGFGREPGELANTADEMLEWVKQAVVSTPGQLQEPETSLRQTVLPTQNNPVDIGQSSNQEELQIELPYSELEMTDFERTPTWHVISHPDIMSNHEHIEDSVNQAAADLPSAASLTVPEAEANLADLNRPRLDQEQAIENNEPSNATYSPSAAVAPNLTTNVMDGIDDPDEQTKSLQTRDEEVTASGSQSRELEESAAVVFRKDLSQIEANDERNRDGKPIETYGELHDKPVNETSDHNHSLGIVVSQEINTTQQTGSASGHNATFNQLRETVMAQIAEHVRIQLDGDQQQVQIRLKPEYLGDVRITLTAKNGLISAEFTAQNPLTSEIIQAAIPELRFSMQQMGVDLGEVSVGLSYQEQQSSFTGERRHQPNRKSRFQEKMIADFHLGVNHDSFLRVDLRV